MLKSSPIINKKFSELTKVELYAILQLRVQVFCVEQNCPYQDIDGLDNEALHFFMTHNDKIIAYARVILPTNDICYLGRIVVAQEFRNKQLASKITTACIQYCEKAHKNCIIEISAQSYLTSFYQFLGFKSTGKFYLEDDIPHEQMQISAD